MLRVIVPILLGLSLASVLLWIKHRPWHKSTTMSGNSRSAQQQKTNLRLNDLEHRLARVEQLLEADENLRRKE